MTTTAMAPAGLVKIRSGRRGSGWKVGDTGILTARHVVEPFLNKQIDRCWAVLDPSPGGPGFACEVVFDDADLDIALLKVLDASASSWQIMLGTQQTVLAQPGSHGVRVEIVGFPDFALDHDGTPNPEGATAVLLPAGGALSGRMPLDVGNSVPDTALAWGGMSGAAVRDEYGRLLGIVVDVSKDRQQRRMHASVVPDPEVDNAFAAALHLVGGPQYLEAVDAPKARRLLQLVDPKGCPYTPLQINGLDSLGVRFSRSDIDTRGDPFYPYVSRDVDDELADALDDRAAAADPRMLILAGDAMAGKSRSLAEAVRRHPVVSKWLLLRPAIGAPLEDVVLLAGTCEALVWLDDLDEYLPWLTVDQLRRLLRRPGLALLATIRSDRLASLAGPDFRAAWDVVTDDRLRQNISLPATWTENEQIQVQGRERVLQDAFEHGKSLGEALGAAHEMVRRLENAPSDLYGALADLIADWPTTGLHTPIPESEATRLWSVYLPAAKAKWLANLSGVDLKLKYEEIRDWLCQPVAGPGTAIVQRRDEGLTIDGLFQQRRSRDHAALPRELFENALLVAARAKEPDSVMLTVAYQAAAAGWESIAAEVLDPLAEVGNQEAINIRQAIARLIKSPARIYIQTPDTIRAGMTITALVVGRMIKAADVAGARVYIDCVIKHKYTGLGIRTYESKGGTRVIPVPEEKTATTRLRVGTREFLSPGRLPAGHAFSEMAQIVIPEDAIGWVRTANVEATWEIAAELLAKGRNARFVVPLTVVPCVKNGSASVERTAEAAVDLSFLGLPEEPIFAGDPIEGTLLVRAKRDLVSRKLTIGLVLESTVHRMTGSTEEVRYKICTQRIELQAGQSVEIPFSTAIPVEIAAASIPSYDVGQPAEALTGVQRLDDLIGVVPRPKARSKKISFSTHWYIEGRIHRNLATNARIKARITVARERPDASDPARDRKHSGYVRRRSQRRSGVADRLASIATTASSEQRGYFLTEILNELFAFEGLPVRDAFGSKEGSSEIGSQVGGVIALDEQLYLVDVRWYDHPLEVKDIASHLVQVYSRNDIHGLMISAAGYAKSALDECRRALRGRVIILAEIEELTSLLRKNGDIRAWLGAKLYAATVDNDPFRPLIDT